MCPHWSAPVSEAHSIVILSSIAILFHDTYRGIKFLLSPNTTLQWQKGNRVPFSMNLLIVSSSILMVLNVFEPATRNKYWQLMLSYLEIHYFVNCIAVVTVFYIVIVVLERLCNSCECLLLSLIQMRIGLLQLRKGKLTKVRGPTGSVVVHLQCTATAAEVLAAAVEKLYYCNSDLEVTTYKLLYPDGKLVTFIPGGSLEFTVQRYKEFMGKQYRELMLYLCTEEDYKSGLLLFWQDKLTLN